LLAYGWSLRINIILLAVFFLDESFQDNAENSLNNIYVKHCYNFEMQQISLDSWIKLLTFLGAVVTFAWGVYQFFLTQRLQSETRRIEATKPFLDRQLKLYTEATQAAATIAPIQRMRLLLHTNGFGHYIGANLH
jgi:hypothetical protein